MMPSYSNIRVAVTEEVIEAAKPRDSSHCMVAEGVREAVPAARRISVDLQVIRFSIPELGQRFTFLTPRAAQIALIDYDQGVTPEPFTMVLRNPQVTKMDLSRRDGTRPRPMTPARKKALDKARETQQKLPARRTIKRGNGGERARPRVEGGRTPPTSSFARRRAFGLRALDR